MGDKEIGQAPFFLQALQEVNDLGLDRDIQGWDRLITDNKLRFNRQGPRNPNPLALTTRKFMGITQGMFRRQTDWSQKLGHFGIPLWFGGHQAMDFHPLSHNILDLHPRI